MQSHTLEGFHMNNFDTLKYSKRALEAGFTKEQAEFQAEEMSKIISEHIATKGDIRELQISVNEDIRDLRASTREDFKLVKKDIEVLRMEMHLEIRALENRMVIKMGSLMVIAVSVLATISKFF